VSSYVLINGLGFIGAIFLLERRFRVLSRPYSDRAYVLAVCSVPFGWLAARVGDCLTRDLPFAQAGFAFYWGLIGASCFYVGVGALVLRPRALFPSINLLLPVIVLSHAVGRIGCFVAGCCYGCLIPHTAFRVPTQLIEASFLAALGILMLRNDTSRHVSNLAVYLTAYPLFRFVIEFLRADDRGSLVGLSTSQFLSIPLFVCGIVMLTRSKGAEQKAISEQDAGGNALPRVPQL